MKKAVPKAVKIKVAKVAKPVPAMKNKKVANKLVVSMKQRPRKLIRNADLVINKAKKNDLPRLAERLKNGKLFDDKFETAVS